MVDENGTKRNDLEGVTDSSIYRRSGVKALTTMLSAATCNIRFI